MPDPREAKTSTFKPDRILHETREFAVAWGRWKYRDEKFTRIAMRWNGKRGAGYPRSDDQPEWFTLPGTSQWSVAILQALLGLDHTDRQTVLATLDELLAPAVT